MITKFMRGLGVFCVLTIAVLIGAAEADQPTPEVKKPIAWMRSGSGPLKPLYAEDVRAEVKSTTEDINTLAEKVQTVKIDPNAPKDEIEKQFTGSISLARHQADINALRDKFTDCMTAMESNLNDRKEDGKLTAENQKEFDKCKLHCDNVLKLMDNLHKNTSSMRTATRQKYFLDAWEEHKQMISELKSEAASCPAMFDTMIKATGTPSKHESKQSEEQ